MAQNLVLNILAKDKTKQALGSVQRGLANLRSALFSVQSAIIGIGGGVAIRALVRTGSEVENLGLRFNFLFGNVKEGTKAFDNLIGFAARVPFSLEEISSASGNLAVVAKDADDLTRILKITGNVAAVTGLDFRQTAEQIQRSFAGGIAAADVFRERGVRALLGFKAGATITAEATIKAFEDTFGENGRFGKATEVLATTFTGTLSMLSDKLFKFQLDTNRAGFFDFFKSALVVINKTIEQNSKALTDFAGAVGQGLVNFIKAGLLGTARLLDSLQIVFKIVGAGIGGLIDLIRALPAGVRELGIVGFLMLGRRGKIIIASIAGLLKVFKVDLDAISDKIFGASKDTESWGKNSEAVAKFLKMVEENIVVSKEQLKELQSALKGVEESSEKTFISFNKIKDVVKNQIKKDFESINDTIGKFILSGVKGFSRSLAEAVVLGKELNKSFKELAQKLLVEALAFTIQIVIQKQIEKLLTDQTTKKEGEKLNFMRQQTSELKRQFAFNAVSSFLPGFAQGGAVSKGRPILVGERGPEMFLPNSTGQITQSARGMSGRAVNVNFNINTIDSRGFDEALVENRATITSIINNALTERGRGELI
tara:strand:+ start:720 stop:2510 length:1791 start_codon:yes stop_codon:yes gene_type:complete